MGFRDICRKIISDKKILLEKQPIQANLTEFDIQRIMDSTNFNRNQIISWHANFLKDCPDGRLTKKKFNEMYQMFYPYGDSEKYAARVFKVFDLDGNNVLDFEEFMVALTLTGRQDPVGKLKFAFKVYDIDQNGRIDREEMTKMVKAIYELIGEDDDKCSKAAKELVNRIFNKLDRDHNGSLNEKEFIEGLCSDPQLMRMLAPRRK